MRMEQSTTDRLRERVEAGLSDFMRDWPAEDADGLYAPVHYLLGLGGKRLRPVMALAACEAEGAEAGAALPVAVAVELFHNFTLMHDDIMDAAPLRRGQLTVHQKWDVNAAILSGDAMFTLSSMALGPLPRIAPLFHRTALQVCQGQQSDMAFEGREGVTTAEYLEMIRLKTSVLLAASCAMGAMAAGADEARSAVWYRFGEQLGLAFQMQDDLLDAFAGQTSGKQPGGDILSHKKTFLWLHTWAQPEGRSALQHWMGVTDRPVEKVAAVQDAMRRAGAEEAAREVMGRQVEAARAALAQLALPGDWEGWFEGLTAHVVERVV